MFLSFSVDIYNVFPFRMLSFYAFEAFRVLRLIISYAKEFIFRIIFLKLRALNERIQSV